MSEFFIQLHLPLTLRIKFELANWSFRSIFNLYVVDKRPKSDRVGDLHYAPIL